MKVFLTVIILVIGCQIYSQFGFFAGTGFGISMNKHRSFNNFVSSYNETIRNLPSYEKDMKGWGAASTFDAGIGLTAANLGLFEINYFKVSQSTHADFSNDHRRQFDLIQKECNVFFSFGVIQGPAHFTIGYGINISYADIESSYIYSDGYQSFGEDGRLNGVYEALAVKSSLGFRAGIPLGEFIALTLKGDWIFRGDVGGAENTPFTDYSDSKFHGSYAQIQHLPQDYNSSTFSTPLNAPNVNTDWREFRIRIGIAIFLSSDL